ncbi:hypothetical protein [Pigmentiphaga sp. CHJ604]|uniref:hypothetical protein n=1 Tax=Pigmentiphaga sp. CHJ604 TaxID=3081984 RepID=UPI0030CB1D23
MLDEVYEASAMGALNELARRPPLSPQPTANFSWWRTVTAPVRGLVAGAVTDPLAFGAEVTGALGDMTKAYGTAGSALMLEGVDSIGLDLDARRQARDRVESGESFSNPVGRTVRQATRDYLMPDPASSSTAEQMLYGFTRYGAKAVGYSLLTGPLGGAVLTGLDEGMATSDDLLRQGVDRNTRTNVGILAGTSAAAGVLLPVAGRTVAGTVGLTAAGGPGAFIAQQAATREILANAGYDKIADQYDPFDPVGLIVSTLVPAGFGAWAMRGRIRAGRTGEPRAEGEPAPRPDLATAAHDPELVDAARVQQVREIVESWNLGSKTDVEAATRSLMAFTRASDQLAYGDRVTVTDLVPLERSATTRAMDEMIARFETARTELVAQAAEIADPGVVRTMRAELETLRQSRPDLSEAGLRDLAKAIQAQEGISYKRALSEARRQAERAATEADARIARLEEALERNAQANRAQQAVGVIDEQLARARETRAMINEPATDLRPVAAAVRSTLDTARTRSAPETNGPEAGARPREGSAQNPAAATPARETGTPGGARQAGGQAPGDPGDAYIAARAASLAAESPDLMVQLEGMDQPMRLADALETIQREAAQDLADVPLLQVAANCFLSGS